MLKSSGMWYRHKQIYRSQWSKSESTEITLRIYGKVGLKLKIQKTKIMTPGPITSWQIDGEMVERSIPGLGRSPEGGHGNPLQ